MGYVGFSVAFAFAIAALMSGRLDAAWARWSRPWTVAAWLFLTVGITLGSWWAYYELGWGGWWFWDPVENASFMPWLVGTALIHSLAVTDKRDAFKSWTVLLAIAAFSLSLLGTFLVRSGVLTSVHAFATDPARGVFILALLGITIGGSLLLYAIRAPTVRDTGSFRLMSREGFLLANNVILLVATGSVLLGTLYPLFLDALKLGKISVGHPYFDTVFLPLMVLLGLLLGIGPIAHWKREEWRDLVKRLWPWAIAALVIALSTPWVYSRQHVLSAAVGLYTAAWIVGTVLLGLRERLMHQRDLGGFIRALPRSFIGMSLAHLGFAMSIVGVTMVSLYGEERDVRLAVGETASVGGYGFRLEELRDVAGPNYQAMEARVTVLKGETIVAELQPQKRSYRVQTNAMTEAGIAAGFFRDLYVAMGEPLSENAWSIRLQYKPLIRWIWFGGVVMACGGFLALSDRRYRLAARKTREVFTETSLPIKASV
jgi:cytochrome c-type biogenesis protein CcmF